MDYAVLSWLNGWVGYSDSIDGIIDFCQTRGVKTMPSMLVLWGLWLWPRPALQRTEIREALIAAFICVVPIMGITRGLANYLPFSPRPLVTPDVSLKLFDGIDASVLDGWSSMPSDHASLFFGFAVAMFTIHRSAGIFLMLWAVFVPSIPRVIIGLHWPSDVLVGWLLGASLAVLIIGPITRFVRHFKIVPFFEERMWLGYPLLLIATYEFGNMFETTRKLVGEFLS